MTAPDDNSPQGDLCIRTLAMPADTNANGDIFGGWLLSQMDIAGTVFATKVIKTRNVTVAIDEHGRPQPIQRNELLSA